MNRLDALDMLEDIDENGEDLTHWEIGFLESMMGLSMNLGWEPTEKEANKIRQIHEERVT